MPEPLFDPELLSLRPVKMPDDEQFLKELYFERRSDLVALPEEIRANILEMQWKGRALQMESDFPGVDRSVVMYDGEPIGEYIVDRRVDEIFGVDLSILAAYRSRGIGGHLVAATRDEARRAGVPFRYHVQIGNRALSLYERLGFEVTRRGDTDLEVTSTQAE